MDFSIVPNTTLFLLMLALGLDLQASDFRRLLQRRPIVALGLFGQLLLLPLIAIALVSALPLDETLAIGLLLIAACPGGATSNMFTRYANGDVALSISLTACSGLVAPLSVPLIVGTGIYVLSGDVIEIPVSTLEMVRVLAMTTALPVLLGMVWRRLHERSAAAIRPGLLGISTTVLVLLVLGLGINTARETGDIVGVFTRSALPVTLLMILCFVFATLGASLLKATRGERRTLVLEIGIQNINLSLVLAFSILQDTRYLGPTLVYLPLMLMFGGGVILLSRARDHG